MEALWNTIVVTFALATLTFVGFIIKGVQQRKKEGYVEDNIE